MPTVKGSVAPFFFVTVWRLDAPLARVWEAIHASERYPEWWPNVLSVSVLEAGAASGLGKLERSVWKTELPYRFTFDTRVTRIEKPRPLEVAASGELEGIGRWQLTEDGGTAVTYTWAVRTNKPWMNRAAPLARPFFVWNHRAVMRKGGRGLAQLLGCRLTGFESSRERVAERVSVGSERTWLAMNRARAPLRIGFVIRRSLLIIALAATSCAQAAGAAVLAAGSTQG